MGWLLDTRINAKIWMPDSAPPLFGRPGFVNIYFLESSNVTIEKFPLMVSSAIDLKVKRVYIDPSQI
jgi:hypothetical protein